MMSIKRKKRHIQPTHPKLSIQRQCELIDLPRSSYYREVSTGQETSFYEIIVVDQTACNRLITGHGTSALCNDMLRATISHPLYSKKDIFLYIEASSPVRIAGLVQQSDKIAARTSL